MSQEYAPAAIHGVFDRLASVRPHVDWTLSGIVGDIAHKYGYHRARAVLPADDYSIELKRDQGGDDWAASALDITPPDALHQHRLTYRLAKATTAGDHRLRCVREWYGSLDSVHVAGWDLATDRPATSDASHLWHVHISFYRDTTARAKLLAAVGDLLAGV